MDKAKLLSLTSEIVSAHASSNEITQEELVKEIHRVFNTLAALGGEEGMTYEAEETATIESEQIKPAVPLEAAFGSDKVFCMICGKGMKTLKRHLSTAHGMRPGQYRGKFGIPAGTPLVSKEYSQVRKKMAKDLNLAERLVKARAARGRKKK